MEKHQDESRKAPDGHANTNVGAVRRVRWKSGVGLALVCAAATCIAAATAPDATDRMIRIFKGVGLSALAVVVWWIGFSGVRLRVRIATLLVLMAAILILGKLSVRNVTFDGDMKPRLHFVWDPPTPGELAEKWLKENAPKAEAAGTSGSEPVRDPGDGAGTVSGVLTIQADDWPRFAGWNGNRQVSGPVCELDWQAHPPKELWRHPVGEGWSSFSIVGDLAFTQEQRGPMECVVCYDAVRGREVWRHEDSVRHETPQGGIGPRATPTVTEDAVFALGATGLLNALDPKTGQPIWQRNICSDADSAVLEWGMSGSPLIHGDLVIVDAGGASNRAVIAYHRRDGSIAWAAGNHKAGYASPRIDRIGDATQLLIFHGDGLAGLDPATGTLLWEYPWTNQYRINVAQPMVLGRQIFLSSGYDSGCALIDPGNLTDGRPADVWPPNKSLKLKFNEGVQLGDYVYGLDDGILSCIDVRNGQRRWKGGRYRFGQVLLWQNVLIVQAEPGFVAVVEASPESFREISRLEALNDRTWNLHAISRNRLFVRNASEAACFELPVASQ